MNNRDKIAKFFFIIGTIFLVWGVTTWINTFDHGIFPRINYLNAVSFDKGSFLFFLGLGLMQTGGYFNGLESKKRKIELWGVLFLFFIIFFIVSNIWYGDVELFSVWSILFPQ